MLRFEHISLSYGSQQILDDLSFEIQEGQMAVLIGPSGCGKTTTLKMINRLIEPTAGRIYLNGQDITTKDKVELRRHIGYVIQQIGLFPNMTVEQNILCALKKEKDPAARRAACAEALRAMRLEELAKRLPGALSGGQQQRAALARILAAKPRILMLDEPFSALDSHLKGVLEQNLVSLFEAFEGTILYVSHDIDESLRFCDRIAVVDAGRIVEMDRGRELVNRPQSVAGLKLSGCKNAPAAEYAGPHAVHVPPWGIDVHTAQEVPRDVKCLGLRAFYVERAEGPGENCYRVRVDRVSDARFERMALLGFLDRDDADGAAVAFETNEMSYLHQHMFWRVSMREGVALPEVGERLWVRIPPDKVYLVSR
mgnify:CR=1 FL=1